MRGVDTEGGTIEILRIQHFFDHTVFDTVRPNRRKKRLEKVITVSVVVEVVNEDTKE